MTLALPSSSLYPRQQAEERRWRAQSGGRQRGWRGSAAFVLALVAAGWLAFFFGRGLVSSALDAIDLGRAVHPDRTVIESGVERQVVARPSVPLTWRQADGTVVRGRVDREALAVFADEAAARLEAVRREVRAAVPHEVGAALAPTFDGMRVRVPAFADWYFAWPTGYAMLGEAASSAAGWVVGADVLSLRERLTLDLERYVQRRFEAIVLRPELSDPVLRQAFGTTLDDLRRSYAATLAELDAAFEALVRAETTHLEPVPASSRVTLDWDSQRLKVAPAAYEKAASLRALPSLTLALAGRSAGVAAARTIAARAAQPVVARAMAAGGLSLAGVGAGVLLGLGADYVANELLERSQRPRFEAEVAEAVGAIEGAWTAAMAAELERAVDAWFDDALALLPEAPGTAAASEGLAVVR